MRLTAIRLLFAWAQYWLVRSAMCFLENGALRAASSSRSVALVCWIRADIEVDVYDNVGKRLGTAKVPFKLNSSTTPAANIPSDATAATAFSSFVKELTHANPLCDVQLKYTGTLEGMPVATSSSYALQKRIGVLTEQIKIRILSISS